MDKISAQNIYQCSTTDRNSPFSTIAKSGNNVGKKKTDKSLKRSPHAKNHDSDIEDDLLKEIQKAQYAIGSFKNQLSQNNNKPSRNLIQELKNIEETIQYKDQIIIQIQEQIKSLKTGRFTYSQDMTDESSHLYCLSYDIKSKKEELLKLQSKYIQRRAGVQKKKNQMIQFQKKYKNKCQSQGTRFISFEQFKSIYRTKNRQQILGKTKKKQKMSLIKEVNRQKGNPEIETKKIKQLITKKNVTQTALKTTKKKHQIEMNDLMGKLQFLRDENNELEDKLLIKDQELRTAENKFSQSRSSSNSKRLISHRRLKTQKNL